MNKGSCRALGAVLATLFVSLFLFGSMAFRTEASLPIPPEVKDFTLRFMKAFGDASLSLAERLDSTEDPDEMARALNTYADAVEPLARGMADLEKKYPEFFENLDEDEEILDPDMLKAEEAFDKTQERMEPSMMKVFHNIENPGIQAALERLEEVMSLMDGEIDD